MTAYSVAAIRRRHDDETARRVSPNPSAYFETAFIPASRNEVAGTARLSLPAMDLPKHRARTTPEGKPTDKAQRNFPDTDSRILASGGSFLQGYNCQAAVDDEWQVIVAQTATNQPPDAGNLNPVLDLVQQNTIVTDGPPPPQLSAKEKMQWNLRTKEGRALYWRRKVIVEPGFGQIKDVRGLKRLLLRGLEGAGLEWSLLCTAHNPLKLFRNQRSVRTAT